MADTHHERWGAASFTVITSDDRTFQILVKGRTRWALEQLIATGRRGCTALERPALRWSAYVRTLRCHGVEVETRREPNRGEFGGTHGRYVLKSQVERLRDGEDAA